LTQGLERARPAARGKTGTLRISLFPVNVLESRRYWETFRSWHPQWELRLRMAGCADPFAQLRDGEADILVTWLPVEEPDLTVGSLLLAEPRVLTVGLTTVALVAVDPRRRAGRPGRSCQRPRQDGDGPVSERSAMVDAMNGSATAASKPGAVQLMGTQPPALHPNPIDTERRGTMRTTQTKGLRRAAGAALAAALLAGTAVAAPGVAAADSGAAVPKAAAAGQAAAGQAAAGQDRPELQEAVQAFVDAGFAGMQVRVNDERGAWVGSAGVSKLGQSAKPPTNGRFWVGSVTKTFTATLVLQLVAEGKIGLDDVVAGYLPEFGLDRRITVRMLLQHTSGLFNYAGGEAYDDGTYVPGLPATGKEWLDNRFHSYRPEELVRFALSKRPRFEPGTDQNYSNTNYTLALLLIEKVTGRSYAEEMRRRILRPLGLRGTVVPGDRTDLPGPHAHGYYRYEDAGQWKVVDISGQNLSVLAGAGDMISTTQDLHTFISALNAGKLLPAPLLAEMRKPYGKLGYGFGLFVQDLGPNCGTVYQHNGSPPHGYGALMYSSPDGKRTLTASVTWVDEATRGPAKDFQKLVDRLVKDVFCGGQAGAADEAKPAQ
jgi:D-alanyl-D-alanine carboxypeptidase